jgi:hypothetical protein
MNTALDASSFQSRYNEIAVRYIGVDIARCDGELTACNSASECDRLASSGVRQLNLRLVAAEDDPADLVGVEGVD